MCTGTPSPCHMSSIGAAGWGRSWRSSAKYECPRKVVTNSSQESAFSKDAINPETNVPNLSSRNCFVSILALGLLLGEARLLPRLAGGGLVLGVEEASSEGRLLGREDARAFGIDVETDKGAGFAPALVTTFLIFLIGPLTEDANEGVLRVDAGAKAVLVTPVPNFFGGKDGTRAISGPDTSTGGESLGTHSTDGLTPASVKNW